MRHAFRSTLLRTALALATVAGPALLVSAPAQAQGYVNATVGGVLTPGVYGRIDIGTAPPPPIYNPQPVIIAQPRAVVVQPAPPVYLYVPPGHQKNWAKHCARYNACGQPVYFVKVDEREYRRQHDDHDRHGHDDDRGRGHGKGRHRD